MNQQGAKDAKDRGPIAEWLRAARRARFKSAIAFNDALAKAGLHVSDKLVESWESGRQLPTVDQCRKIARVFDHDENPLLVLRARSDMSEAERVAIEADANTARAEADRRLAEADERIAEAVADADRRIAARDGLTGAEEALFLRLRAIEHLQPGSGLAEGLAALVSVPDATEQLVRVGHVLTAVDQRSRAGILSALDATAWAIGRQDLAAQVASYKESIDYFMGELDEMTGTLERAKQSTEERSDAITRAEGRDEALALVGEYMEQNKLEQELAKGHQWISAFILLLRMRLRLAEEAAGLAPLTGPPDRPS